MPAPEFIVAIPARFGSTRLPGKPLRLIGGDPMIVHVARRALEAGAQQVVIATDDPRIAEAVGGYPVTVCMTRAGHVSGTDRIAECADQLDWPDDRIVVNLQGDEPFVPPSGIRAVASALAHADPGTVMSTLAVAVGDIASLLDPNVVKVVRAADGHALYFSRAPIPWDREGASASGSPTDAAAALRHIGIYAYRAGFLRCFTQLPVGRLERIEALEQLRVLEAGYRILVALAPVAFPPGVDTEADLLAAESNYQATRQ